MRKNVKRKRILLITFAILFTLSLLISNNLNYNEKNSDQIINSDILNLSAVSAPIYIVDSVPSANWSVAKTAGICTGEGTYSDPYVIEDLVIDCGDSGCGISIELSNVFFKIENCTIYNSGSGPYDAGIELCETSNGNINENNVSNCKNGIYIDKCERISISGNTANNNREYGIYLYRECYNSTISNNTANYNRDGGIAVEDNCHNIIISDNIANYNFWDDSDSLFPEPTLGCGIYLYWYSTLNTISGNRVYHNTRGIFAQYCSYNNISGNIANYNDIFGIVSSNSNNNTISGNTANYNLHGIAVGSSDNTTIMKNLASYNTNEGIGLDYCNNIQASENIMIKCGLVVSGIIASFIPDTELPSPPEFPEQVPTDLTDTLRAHNIDTSNLVNGKPLYYYTNEINLRPSNYTNAGQVILINCNDSIVSNLNVSYGSIGISLFYCNNNTISENIANYNNKYGIFLHYSNYNIISGNTLIGNEECWEEINCENNSFENNDCGRSQPAILGFNIFLLIGVISIVSASIMKKLKIK